MADPVPVTVFTGFLGAGQNHAAEPTAATARTVHDYWLDGIVSVVGAVNDQPLHWQGVATWLDMLVATRGESLLRIKGILNVAGQDWRVAILPRDEIEEGLRAAAAA